MAILSPIFLQGLIVAAGGAIGALLRFLSHLYISNRLGHDFPYATLSINVIGSLFMGFLYIILHDRLADSHEWRSFLLIGLLSAFTTFSTFSFETLNLMLQGELVKAIINVFLSVVLCIFAAWIGLLLARQI